MVYESRTQSEELLEKEMIVQLVGLGYEKVKIPDIKKLQANFRDQVNRLNVENLEDTPLSDKEFERLLLGIEGKSVYESAKLLRIKQTISTASHQFTCIKLKSKFLLMDFYLELG